MKVKILRGDFTGCGHYRCDLPAAAVNAADLGVEVEVVAYLDAETNQNGTVRRVLGDAEVVVFQRPLGSQMLEAMLMLQTQGVRCVVEIDDDLSSVPTFNSAYAGVAPHLSPHSNYKNLERACLLADWVTVSTPALRKYAPHGRVSVVPNAVPRRLTELPFSGAYPVGWSGSIGSHRMDLEVAHGRIPDVEFHVIGLAAGVQEALGLQAPPTETGWLSVEDYYLELPSLQVAICPIEPHTVFNASKSFLKPLEFAAVGVPFVASPSPEYERFVQNHGGILARKSKHWTKEISRLLDNPDDARELGESLRQEVIKHHLSENAADKWTVAWYSALNRVKG